MMTAFSFKLAAWRASCPYFSDSEQWRHWAAGGQIDAASAHQPGLAFLPAMQRRRLSPSARLMFDAAWPLAEAFPNCPLVFASHDGEINRSFELWLSLLREQTVSPASFGLSVHNALAGQWSMLRQDMSENTALAADEDSLESALAEAYALLQEGADKVWVVLADEPLHREYAVAAERAPFAHALAMVLEAGDDYRISLLKPDAEKENPPRSPYWGALEWIRFMLSDRHQWERCGSKRRWLWQKNP